MKALTNAIGSRIMTVATVLRQQSSRDRIMNQTQVVPLSRRAFLSAGTLLLSPLNSIRALAQNNPDAAAVTLGLVTDLHHADKPSAGSRHYRETRDKLAQAAEQYSHHRLDHLVELGDFIDAADSVETELNYLKQINSDFAQISKNRHYVLGNHCVHTLNKREFLDTVERTRSYYSFDSGGVHFIILDACFRSDGEPYGRKNFEWTDPNIPAAELEWLKDDLNNNRLPVVVFAHQRLDVSNHYGIKNAAAVRRLLESTGKTLAVFQGHSHQNDLREINGIHYCTLVAMVEGSGLENNGFSLLQIDAEANIQVDGFVRQKDYSWKS